MSSTRRASLATAFWEAQLPRPLRIAYSGAWQHITNRGVGQRTVFETRAGFTPRTGFRQLSHFSSFFFRPADRALTSWGPELSTYALLDQEGTPL